MYENKFYSIEPWMKSSQNIYMYVSLVITGYEPFWTIRYKKFRDTQ